MAQERAIFISTFATPQAFISLQAYLAFRVEPDGE